MCKETSSLHTFSGLPHGVHWVLPVQAGRAPVCWGDLLVLLTGPRILRRNPWFWRASMSHQATDSPAVFSVVFNSQGQACCNVWGVTSEDVDGLLFPVGETLVKQLRISTLSTCWDYGAGWTFAAVVTAYRWVVDIGHQTQNLGGHGTILNHKLV